MEENVGAGGVMEYNVGKPYLVFSEKQGLVIVTLIFWTSLMNYASIETENGDMNLFYIRDSIVEFLGEHDLVGEL